MHDFYQSIILPKKSLSVLWKGSQAAYRSPVKESGKRTFRISLDNVKRCGLFSFIRQAFICSAWEDKVQDDTDDGGQRHAADLECLAHLDGRTSDTDD